MDLKSLPFAFTVCKLPSLAGISLEGDFTFLARTDEEISLLCKTDDVPAGTEKRDDGWKGFRIEGSLDFSLIGILANISTVLAENGISIFAVSTFTTDYIFVKEHELARALSLLAAAGHTVL